MSDEAELLRLRAIARTAEDRYFRLKLLLGDPATLEAAHAIWIDAERGVREHEEKKNR